MGNQYFLTYPTEKAAEKFVKTFNDDNIFGRLSIEEGLDKEMKEVFRKTKVQKRKA